MHFFKVRNFSEGRPFWLHVPSAERPNYATDVLNQKRKDRNLRNVACVIGLEHGMSSCLGVIIRHISSCRFGTEVTEHSCSTLVYCRPNKIQNISRPPHTR